MAQAPDFVSLDFETGSTADLKKVGAHTYAEDPSTRVICMAFTEPWTAKAAAGPKVLAFPPGGFPYVAVYDDGMISGGPDTLTRNQARAALFSLAAFAANGGLIHAWNATFEWVIWNNVLVPELERIGVHFPHLRETQMRDTMARAAYWGLPLSLDMAAQALPRLGIQKDMAGNRLMKSMSRPRRVDPGTGELIWWDQEDRDKAIRLYEYCRTDVLTEQAIGRAIPALPPDEQALWELDARANARGIPFDNTLATNMERLAKAELARLDGEMNTITRGAVPKTTNVRNLTGYCGINGLPEAEGGLAKDRLPFLIDKANARGLPEVAKVLELRQEAAKSSVAKLSAMRAFAGPKNIMRGLTQYYGAFRTGRWAGRGPQIQNFPRSAVKDQDGLVAALLDPSTSPGDLEHLFGVTPLTAISSALRGCAWVDPDTGLFAALDFSQIEARVLAWLSGNDKVLNAYRTGKDLYVVAASGIYRVREDEVTPDQRQVGKVSVLALGYGGGVGAFQTMAKNYGLDIPDAQAEDIKVAWRHDNHAVVRYWYDLNDAAINAIENPGLKFEAGAPGAKVTFKLWHGHLVCRLPSTRVLVYRDAEIHPNKFDAPGVTYMGVDQYTRKWVRIETYGGKLCENITQAVARDVMAAAMVALDKLGGVDVLGSVHDEVLLRVKDLQGFNSARYAMLDVPAWAQGLPLDADGYYGARFKKG